MTTIVYGVDAAPTRLHTVRAEFDNHGLPVHVMSRTSEEGEILDARGEWVAIEDPTGVLFQTTNSMLWSQTCRTAGEVFGLNHLTAAYAKPQDARQWLANASRQQNPPKKDREVKECLQALYGQGCFDKEKLCPKVKNKTHDTGCPICLGTGLERVAGVLSELNTPHFRDAFVVAAFMHCRLVGTGEVKV